MERFVVKERDKIEESIIRSIRIRSSLDSRLEEIARQNNVSFNKLVVDCILYALDNLETKENENEKKSE